MISSFCIVLFPTFPSYSSSFPGFTHQANSIPQPPPCQLSHQYVSICHCHLFPHLFLHLWYICWFFFNHATWIRCRYLIVHYCHYLYFLGSHCSSSSLVKLYSSHLHSISWLGDSHRNQSTFQDSQENGWTLTTYWNCSRSCSWHQKHIHLDNK